MERVKLDRTVIEKLFETGEHQSEVLIGIYKLVYPEWDRIDKIQGWPTITRATSLHIGRLFMNFDRKHHPDVVQGGAWFNSGFSTVDPPEDLKDWEVIKAPYTLKEAV